MNHFGDLNAEEFGALHLGLRVDSNTSNKEAEGSTLESSVDPNVIDATNNLRAATTTNSTHQTNKNNTHQTNKNNTHQTNKNNTHQTNKNNKTNIPSKSNFTLPKSVDWRKHGAVTPIQNQGQCGGCYSFAAAAALESLRYIKEKKLEYLSVQQILDCSGSFGNTGCGGGFIYYALRYTMFNGLQLASDYEYTGDAGNCKVDAKKVVFKNNGYSNVPPKNFTALKAAVAYQPVAAGIESSSMAFQLYKNGTLTSGCTTDTNHAVLIVGYGTDKKGQDYWIVKNSWGTLWGIEGYFNIAMGNQNDGAGVCGINMIASYPTL